MAKIDNLEFQRLCWWHEQTVSTARDYILDLVKRDKESYISIDTLSVILEITDDVAELRQEREADNGKS